VSSSSYDMYPSPHMTCILLLICLQPMKVIGNGCFGKVMMVKFKKNGIFICLSVPLPSLNPKP
jgi:hypothetical protein